MKKILGILAALSIGLLVVLWTDKNLTKHLPDRENKNENIHPLSILYSKPSENNISVLFMDLYDENVPTPLAKKTRVVSIELMLKTAQIAKTNGWQGNKKEKLPVTISDFPDNYLQELAQTARSLNQKITMPEEYSSLLTSDNAKEEIIKELLLARKEYSQYLHAVGIAQKYITQMDTVTLPSESARFIYNPDTNPYANFSQTLALIGDDRTKLKFELSAVDVYLQMKRVIESGILGVTDINSLPPEKLKLARNLGTRVVAYHEYTHALQEAANFINSPEGYDSPAVSVEDINGGIGYKWGGDITKEVRNRDIASEAQADGVSNVVLDYTCHLSVRQQQQVWDHVFAGYLEEASGEFSQLMQFLELNYPQFNSWNFASLVSDAVNGMLLDRDTKNTLLKEMAKVDMSSYGGYLNIMKPDQVKQIWKFLQK